MSQSENLASFRPWREWVADDAGDVFPTFASFEWFCRRHRARLVRSGQLILRPGSAGNLVGPNISNEVLAILREESSASLAASKQETAA